MKGSVMISATSVWAVVLRHARMWKRDPNYILGGFYWPFLDILIWGFLGAWIQRSQIAQFSNYEVVALLSILLWQVIGRGCNIMSISLCEELWSRNLVNLFSLPLRISEWMLGVILFNALMMVLLFLFCTGIIYFFYNVPLGYIFSTFFLFAPPLFFSSIGIGFACLSIIVSLGRRGAEFGFIFGWLFMPFSGAFYPIEVLPAWAQTFTKFMPMSYVFQGMRNYLMHHQDPTSSLIKGYLLSLIFALCSLLLFAHCFNKSKGKGLARLSD